MAVKEGWTGRVYEDFEVGDIYQHPLGRTVLAADNTWFTLLSMNTNPIHFDHAYAAKDRVRAGHWSTRRSRWPSSPVSRSSTCRRT